jgi:hypothetical protein
MDSNETQKEKATDPNSVTIDGDSQTTVDKATDPNSVTFVTEVGMQTDCNEIQPSKTWLGQSERDNLNVRGRFESNTLDKRVLGLRGDNLCRLCRYTNCGVRSGTDERHFICPRHFIRPPCFRVDAPTRQRRMLL